MHVFKAIPSQSERLTIHIYCITYISLITIVVHQFDGREFVVHEKDGGREQVEMGREAST